MCVAAVASAPEPPKIEANSLSKTYADIHTPIPLTSANYSWAAASTAAWRARVRVACRVRQATCRALALRGLEVELSRPVEAPALLVGPRPVAAPIWCCRTLNAVDARGVGLQIKNRTAGVRVDVAEADRRPLLVHVGACRSRASGLAPTTACLERFFENRLCGTRHELRNRFLRLDWPLEGPAQRGGECRPRNAGQLGRMDEEMALYAAIAYHT